MLYYVLDTTTRPIQVATFPTYRELVAELEKLSIKKFRQTRHDRMVLLEEVGHGDDDARSVNFVRTMAEAFEMGVIREGKLIRCDVTAVEFFQKEEFGN